jgi:hypothetical protein
MKGCIRSVQEEKTLVVTGLHPMPGYRVDREAVGMRLTDAEGGLVARLQYGVAFEDDAEAEETRNTPGKPAARNEDSQDACEALLLLAYSDFLECRILRERVEELGERLEQVEEERDKSDRIAEDLYTFFSRTARNVARRKRAARGESRDDY